jgi:hypothetical protein
VLISAAHPEVQRRGSRYSQELGDRFGRVILRVADEMSHADPERAIRACFEAAFSASIIRVAYGPAFASPTPRDDAEFVRDLGTMAVRYLLAGEPA